MEIPPYYVYQFLLGALAIFSAWRLCGKPKEPPPLQTRLDFFDFAKGAAMLGVILIHAGGVALWGNPYGPLFGFAIPAFILFSGYLLARRHSDKLDLGEYFGGIFWRILAIYALFVLAQHLFSNGFSLDLPALALDFLLGRPENGNYYFIPLILQFYLLFPLLKKFKGIILSPPGLLAAWAFTLLFEHLTYVWQQPYWNSNQLAIVFFGRYLAFFAIGMWLAVRGFEKMRARQSAALAAVFFIAAAAMGLLTGALYIGYLFQLGVIFSLHSIYHAGGSAIGRSFAGSALAAMGRNSLVIYLVHAYIIYELLSKLPIHWDGPLGYFGVAAAAAVLSYAFSALFMAACRRIAPAAG